MFNLKSKQMDIHDDKAMFHFFVFSTWLVISLYSVLYFFFKAYFLVGALFLGIFFFCPIIFLIEKKNFYWARVIYIFSVNYYIYSTSLGLGHSVRVEYFSIPASILGLLLSANAKEKSILVMGAVLPLITWILSLLFGTSFLSDELLFLPEQKNLFISINFLLSTCLTMLFVMIFVKKIQNQQMQMVSSSKFSSLGEMAGGIAHEINNPLAVILGKTGLIKIKIETKSISFEKISEEIQKIEQTALRISKIIKGLKMFSRNAENDPLSVCFVQDIIQDTLVICQERLKGHSIDLKISISENDKILCRPSQIAEVLLNLISNSIDAISDKDKKWIEIKTKNTNDAILIAVTDSGTGITQDIVEKLMMPFFTTKPIGKGTGLGLAIAKGIVEQHGGELYYDRDSNHTSFIMKFPDLKRRK